MNADRPTPNEPCFTTGCTRDGTGFFVNQIGFCSETHAREYFAAYGTPLEEVANSGEYQSRPLVPETARKQACSYRVSDEHAVHVFDEASYARDHG